MKKEILTRKELYDLVWNTPRTKILEKYAISNSGFLKILKDLEIPHPKGGYWMKLKHKKPTSKIKLSNLYEGKESIELIIRENNSPINYDQSPLTILTKEITNDPKAPLKVSSILRNPDILIKNTIEEFKYLDKNGRYAGFSKLTLPIRYDINDKKRALRLMDTFVKLLKYRGHKLSEDINGYIKIYVKGIEIDFDLREKTKRIPAKDIYSSSEYIPTGKFVFSLGKYSRKKELTDGKQLLETRIAEMIAFLELYAEKELEWEEQCRINEMKREKEEKIRNEFETKRNNEISRFNELISKSELYNKTQIIRTYIDAVEKNAIEKSELTPELKNWVIWARDKTDWYDPIVNKYDELLKDVEK